MVSREVDTKVFRERLSLMYSIRSWTSYAIVENSPCSSLDAESSDPASTPWASPLDRGMGMKLPLTVLVRQSCIPTRSLDQIRGQGHPSLSQREGLAMALSYV